jgi:hypothetical protein
MMKKDFLTLGNDESIRFRRIFRFRVWYCSSIVEKINRHRSDFSFVNSTLIEKNKFERIYKKICLQMEAFSIQHLQFVD